MSVYFSKFGLNTYRSTPYFQAQLPNGYPESRVLQKCRAFRRLPPNLRRLAALAKQWAMRKHPEYPAGMESIERYYDAEGNELDPNTGRVLTDPEIDAQWTPDPSLGQFKVRDIPIPPGGFPDPDTWEDPAPVDPNPEERPTRGQLLSDIRSRGSKATSEEYGIPIDQLPAGAKDAEWEYQEALAAEGEKYEGAPDDDGEIIGIATGELYNGPPIPDLVDQTVQETYRLAYGPGSEQLSPAKRQKRIEMYREALRVRESQRRKKPRA